MPASTLGLHYLRELHQLIGKTARASGKVTSHMTLFGGGGSIVHRTV
jgi:hypothetical protein